MMKMNPTLRVLGLFAVPLLLAVTCRPTHGQTTSSGFVKEFGTMWTFDAPPLEYWAETYDFHPDQAWLASGSVRGGVDQEALRKGA